MNLDEKEPVGQSGVKGVEAEGGSTGMKVQRQDGVWCFGQKFGKTEPNIRIVTG